MPSRLKVDEDLSEDLATLLRNSGFDAQSVHQQELTGSSDDKLWNHVQTEGRVFVTADKGFGKLSQVSAFHHGLILLRPQRESRLEFLRLVEKLIADKLLNNLENVVIVATSDRIRIRRKPV